MQNDNRLQKLKYKKEVKCCISLFQDDDLNVVYHCFTLHHLNRKPWPLDGMKFETLKEQHAKRNPEDLEIDYGKFNTFCFHRNL